MSNSFQPSRRAVLGGAFTAAAATAAGLALPTAARAQPRAEAAPGLTPAGVIAAGGPKRSAGQQSMIEVPYRQRDTVRIGLIGLGNRGGSMSFGWASVPGAVVVGVCDIRPERTKVVADKLAAQGHPRPDEYGGSEDSYLELLARDDIDFVYIATPWEFHHLHGKAALEADKDVAVELPIATELDELWDLVDTCERTRRHLMLAENCSYGRNELAMLKMSHEGIFGDITDGHGGYLHDLRELLFGDNYYYQDWRRKWHTRSVASFYAMHGFAPIAACMDINRGDRVTTLSATATAPRGLADYRERFMPPDHPSWDETYVHGDTVTCMMNTHHGRTIRAEHAVCAPTPYSRINTVVGSRGKAEDYPSRIYVEPDHSGHAWQDFGPWRDEFDHWLWTTIGDENQGGHGGMDYVMQWRIVNQIRRGQVPDIDIYDSAVWCAPVPLSVTSLEAGGTPVEVPDFTRGDWAELRLGLDSVLSEMPS